MKQVLLHGEGTKDAPYWITGYRQEECGSIKGIYLNFVITKASKE